jgi:hypothetical protein
VLLAVAKTEIQSQLKHLDRLIDWYRKLAKNMARLPYQNKKLAKNME